MSVFGDDVNYDLEFRSTEDDGWYNCGVVLEHGTRLRVKFKDTQCKDEVFSISDFSTKDDVAKFLLRFRPESESIGDNGCSRVYEGLMVSAADVGGKHLRKFDAIVDAVCKKEHSTQKCLCTCLLFWQHGPEEGRTTAANVGDIYLIMSGSVDPTVVNFTKLVKEKVNRASVEFSLVPKNLYSSNGTSSNETITKPQEVGSVGPSSHDGCSTGFVIEQDVLSDQGRESGCEKETSSRHYLILENVERDVCPLFMTDFICEWTSVNAQAYIVTNLSSETYARVAIVADNRTELEKIYEFVNDPNHFIVSSSGRPWVLAEDKLRSRTFSTNLHGFPPIFEKENRKKDLKVVRLGTEEYTEAKQQNDLYLMYRKHLNGLVERLAMEEKKMTQGPAH